MKNLNLRSSWIKIIEGIIFPLLILSACSESKKPDSYIAKVNDSYLTESEFAVLIDSQFVTDASRSAVIKNWVRQEILYQEALKEELTETKEFNETIENTKKQLAVALILEKFAATAQPQFTNDELEDFFEENESSFKIPFNAYYLNRVNFSNRDAAVKFRTDLIMTGWEDALKKSKHDPELVNFENTVLISEQDIQPVRMLRILEGLYPLEISIVIPDERGYYSVVQLLEKFPAGSVPAFHAVKNEVERRFRAALTELAVDNYINELYSLSEVEINK